jgi:hypothetical protein
MLSLFPAARAAADDNQPATAYMINIRSCDEIWTVSSRALDPCRFSPQQLCVTQLIGDQWERRSIDCLLETHRNQIDKPMVMYVHGNRLDYYWGRRRGLHTYQDLTVTPTAMPPIRYVIWDWPSEDNDRMIINYPRNLQRSLDEGNVLGWFLANAGDSQRIGVLAYSLGVQVLGSALEVASNCYGAINCCHAAIIGAVTHCRWPHNQQQGQAVLAGMSGMLFVDNQEDYTVQGYRKLCKLRRPCSPSGFDLLLQYDYEGKIQRIDVTCVVRDGHQIHQYLMHESIACRVATQLVLGDATQTHLPTPAAADFPVCEVYLHCEPANPASNPRRKQLTIRKSPE